MRVKRPVLTLFIISFVIIGFILSNQKFIQKHTVSPPSCNDPLGCITLEPKAPLKIGIMQDLTGTAAPFGIDQLRSVELASVGINAVSGHPLALFMENSACTPELGRVVASKLVSIPDMVGIIGPTCSSTAAAVREIVDSAGLVMISGTSGAPSLTSVGKKTGEDWFPGFFRTKYSIMAEGKAAAHYVLRDLAVQKAAIINDGDVYTQGYTEAFKEDFTAGQGSIVLDSAIDKGEQNMGPIVDAIIDSQAELVFMPLFAPEALTLVRALKKIPAQKQPLLFCGFAIQIDSFIENIGMAGEGIYFITGSQAPQTPRHSAFLAAWEEKYGETPQSSLYDTGADAFHLLLYGIEQASQVDAEGRLHMGRTSLRDALRTVERFPGLTGQLTCDAFGDCGVLRYKIIRLDAFGDGIDGLEARVLFQSTESSQPLQ